MSPLLIFLSFFSFAKADKCPWNLPGLQHWSESATWDGVPPSQGKSFSIDKPVLLDMETPPLGTVRIIHGGMIVFSPHHKVKLTADNIVIMNNGSMLIGTPECTFKGDAEIELTGDYAIADVTMGDYTKGIYAEVGGSLDIHGEKKLSWTKIGKTLTPHAADEEYVITLIVEPFGWKSGDKLVIASTDYDMYQAEEVEVVDCNPCVPLHYCTCMVRGELKYTHYGEIYKGVDMRAEVGLLSRNIKVYGNMKDENDIYGGHIKAFEGFETFRIQGAELTKMGHKGVKGRYPIHWHMAKEIDPNKTYAMDNSIHHVFQRCITVHGTHGVRVVNNVAYNTFGHCYFLEDGGEKYNTFHHNLGLVTQVGPTIPSDRLPATFWITSPLTIVTDNSAAGSDGIGIWYIFAGQVTGPSANESFFQDGESFRTQILTFETNTVHSNVDTGYMFGHELLPDQDFNGGTEKCDPRQNPLDPDSDQATNLVKSLTAFKNRKQNSWSDCRATTYDNYMSSDSNLGLTLAHNSDITNSIFIGESNNLGEPNMVRLRNKTVTMWHRSTPQEHGGGFIGIQLYDGNPYVHGNSFCDFYDDEWKIAGAIGFRKPHAGELPTLFKQNFFDFEDGVEGNYVKGMERHVFGGSGSTERMGQIFDWDGTITGQAMSMIVRDQPFYTSSWCEARPHWGNMSICPHRYVNAAGYGSGFQHKDLTITRNDIPAYPEISNIYPDPWHPKLSTDHSYLYSFSTGTLPSTFSVRLEGLDSGNSLLIGFCTPLGALPEQVTFHGRPVPQQLPSFEDLLSDRSGTGYFWDHDVGAVFRRFQVDLPRTSEDKEACVPYGNQCPEFFFETEEGLTGDTECRSRAYPKYQVDPL